VILLPIIFVSLMSTLATRWLILEQKFPPIRASAAFTLIFVLLLELFNFPTEATLSSAILGGSFVGMTEVRRLRKKSLLFASLFFSLCFYYVIPYNRGLGGALGCAAFLSCLFSYFLRSKLFSRLLRESN
jgi:hypothetical protein